MTGLKHTLSKLSRPHALIALFGVLIVSVIWAGTTAVIRRDEADAAAQAIKVVERLLDTYEAQTLRALNEVHQSLRLAAYARQYAGKSGTIDQLQQQDLLLPNAVFTTRIVGPGGEVEASSREAAMRWPIGGEALTTNGQSYLVRISKPHQPQSAAEAMIDVARPVNAQEPDGELVVVTLPVSYLVSDYDDSTLGRAGMLAIVGTDGTTRAKRQGDGLSVGEAVDIVKLLAETEDTDRSANIVRRVSPGGDAQYVAARRLFGFPLAVVVGISEKEYLAPVKAESGRKSWQAALAAAMVLGLTVVLSMLTRSVLLLSEREREASQKHADQVEFLALHDSLTGLPNRAHFNKALATRMEDCRASAERFALIYIDLDGFKDVNDTQGHHAGDLLLTQVARRLKQCVREDDVVARLGGDEFAVLLAEPGELRHIDEVAQRLVTKIAQPYALDGRAATVTASVGVATFPEDGSDEEEVTRAADRAMYSAKKSGKNNVRFASDNV